ncbi:MAG TPA: phosphohistidine phosphatase SixA [Verrucomicrobiae bacterium]|jgi:phosphohistidine phosphatase
MNLFILRHAEAEEKGPAWAAKEEERPLTRSGAKKFRAAVTGMDAMGLSFDVVLSSPFTRARQTAEIVMRVLKIARRIVYTSHLEPEQAPAKVIEEIRHAHMDHENVLLVGHEPYLTNLVSLLVSGADGLRLEFKKGGLCKVEIGERLEPGRCGTLKWLLTQRQLILLANEK